MEIIKKRLSRLRIQYIKYYDDQIRVFAQIKNNLSACKFCQSHHIQKHGISEVCLTDLPVEEKKVFVFIQKRRFKCLDCSKTFFEKTPYQFSNNKMTIYIAKYIMQNFGKTSNNKLAKFLKIDRRTVEELFYKNKGK